MKLLLFFCFILAFGLFGSSLKNPAASIPGKEKTALLLTDTIDFANQVQPVLIKNCSPCHFAGGKMYEKMPFDKDTTIINHEKGILKRIKGEENALLRSFIQQKIKQ